MWSEKDDGNREFFVRFVQLFPDKKVKILRSIKFVAYPVRVIRMNNLVRIKHG